MTEKGYYGVTRSSDYLAHHGILGQKWGVRRFQNKDGSLTAAGKKRYSHKDVEDAFVASMRAHSDALAKVAEGNDRIPEMADELSQEYQREYENLKFSKADKSEIYDRIKKDHYVYDKDSFDDAVYDVVDRWMDEKVAARLKDKRSAFEKAQDEYWNAVHAISNEVVDAYGDENIDVGRNRQLQGRLVVNNLLGSKLRTSFNAHISRHFDDYWVYNTPGFENGVDRAVKRFSYSEYHRLYG